MKIAVCFPTTFTGSCLVICILTKETEFAESMCLANSQRSAWSLLSSWFLLLRISVQFVLLPNKHCPLIIVEVSWETLRFYPLFILLNAEHTEKRQTLLFIRPRRKSYRDKNSWGLTTSDFYVGWSTSFGCSNSYRSPSPSATLVCQHLEFLNKTLTVRQSLDLPGLTVEHVGSGKRGELTIRATNLSLVPPLTWRQSHICIKQRKCLVQER